MKIIKEELFRSEAKNISDDYDMARVTIDMSRIEYKMLRLQINRDIKNK
jgi:hypothetical protein